MENYIINNKTIGLLKNKNKTIVICTDKVYVINKNINKLLEYNCNYYGSSFIGRKNSAKSILNIKYKLPILISEEMNLILIQLNSPRYDKCMYLVVNKILKYEENKENLKINCINNYTFFQKISKNAFESMLLKSFRLNNILIWRKNANFL